MKTKIYFFVILSLISISGIQAQVAINTNSAAPDQSAMLDVSSTTRGLLLPRMTETQRLSIASPATGLMVYQSDGSSGIYVNTGTPISPSWFYLNQGGTTYWNFNQANNTLYPADNSYHVGFGTDNALRQLHLTGSVELPRTTGPESGVIFKNGSNFIHDAPGTEISGNTFLGRNAGSLTSITGDRNTGLGEGALYNLSNGTNNTAVGYNALFDNAEGKFNTAVGSSAMYGSPGDENTAIGCYSLAENDGANNTAVGALAARQNTTGNSNIAIGNRSLQYNWVGSNNIAIGRFSARGSTNVENMAFNKNITIGDSTGVDFGYGAKNNILIGYRAGTNITHGDNNLIIGHNLFAPVYNGDYQMYLGGLIYGDMNKKQLSLGNTSPDESAILELDSDSLGFLLPRMLQADRTSIINPAKGLLVYQTDGTDGLYLNTGTPGSPVWKNINGASSTLWTYNSTNATIHPATLTDKLGLGTNNATAQLTLTGSLSIPLTCTSTNGVIFRGINRFIHSYEVADTYGDNLFIGLLSGSFSMSKNSSMNDCSYNTAVGDYSMNSITYGNKNTANGSSAMHGITYGHNNVAMGYQALYNGNSGNYNVALGSMSLDNNTNDSHNIAIGYNAAIGSGAQLSSDNNTIIGHKAGESMGSYCDGNILLGYQAGDNINGGDYNLIIGYDLDAPAPSGNNQLYIGGLIYGNMNNNQVAIGTTSPQANFHLLEDSDDCLMKLESDDGVPIIEMDGNSTANSQIKFLDDGTYMGAIGYNHSSDNIFFYEDYSMVYKDGLLGIRVTSPTYTLQLPNSSSTGVALAYAWYTYSDERIKSNIQPLAYGLDEISRLLPKSFIHHPQVSEGNVLKTDPSSGTPTIGFIAQEVWGIIPEAVFKPENENEELWSIDYSRLIPVMINGIKELSAENEQLKEQNQEMLRLIHELGLRIDKLEGK